MSSLLKSLFLLLLFIQSSSYAQENIVFPSAATAIIDITKPPYNADKTGKIDCTNALIRAYDDVLKELYNAYKQTLALKKANPNLAVTREGKPEHVLFPFKTTPSYIIYIPNGKYIISNTIEYSYNDLRNTLGNELSRQIHFQGQSKNKTIIKLTDNAPGFGEGIHKPVINFIKGEKSNVAMNNTFENITLDIGSGNPGAVGIQFAVANTGAIRNVVIKSSDPGKAGAIGLNLNKGNPMGLFKNILIEGFDYGISNTHADGNTIFENIVLKSQKTAGFRTENTPVSIRNLISYNKVPALQVAGSSGHLVIIDSKLNGGSASNTAMDLQAGFLFARNIKIEGYGSAVKKNNKPVVLSKQLSEYSSHGTQRIFNTPSAHSLNLPVEETPDIPWEQNLSQWVSVNQYGAKGDGVHDDSPAIQAAINSGKSTVYFNPGVYLINSSITVPASVKRLNFMYADLKAGDKLKEMENKGAFIINGNSPQPLIIEDLFAWEDFHGKFYFIEHASTRTVVLSDLHLQAAAMYINTVKGGSVFIEDVLSVDQEGEGNCFKFTGQKVWARQLNAERSNPEVINDGSVLWILGFKTESNGISFETKNGGSTEILGGHVNNYSPKIPADMPILINDESDVSFIASTNGRSDEPHYFKVMVRETRNGVTKDLKWEDVPRRYENQSVIPLYVGYK